MKAMAGMLCALVLAAAGCANTGHSTGTPCEDCNYGYVQAKKSSERKVWCVVDGKAIDCKKDPSGCPECAKAKMK